MRAKSIARYTTNTVPLGLYKQIAMEFAAIVKKHGPFSVPTEDDIKAVEGSSLRKIDGMFTVVPMDTPVEPN